MAEGYIYEYGDGRCYEETFFNDREEAIEEANEELTHMTSREKKKIEYFYVAKIKYPDFLYEDEDILDNFEELETVWDYKDLEK